MSVESDTAGAHAAAAAPPAPPAPNPTAMGLVTFIPGGVILGLWFVGYLPAGLAGGMIPIILFCTGLFELITTVIAIRAGQNAVGAIFGIFSSFWISFGVLLFLLNNGLLANAAANGGAGGPLDPTTDVTAIQSAYLLAYAITFVLLTLFTLRLPIAFTTAFVFVTITFVLAYLGVTLGAAGLLPIAGITTFIFVVLFAYLLADAFGQELGGKPLAVGSPIQK